MLQVHPAHPVPFLFLMFSMAGGLGLALIPNPWKTYGAIWGSVPNPWR